VTIGLHHLNGVVRATRFLSVNSPAPKLTARVRYMDRIKVRDRVIYTGLRLGLGSGIWSALTRIIIQVRVN